jgi:GNAT superfamily N-acetyltransferase
VGRDALAEVDWNYLDANRVFVACSDRGEYLERKEVAIVCCGLPAQELNWGLVKPPCADLAATAEAVRAYFTGRALPFQLSARELDGERPLRALEAGGWRRKPDPTPGMTLAVPASVPKSPAPLEIARVRSPEELVAFRETAFQGFGFPAKTARLFLNERLLAFPGVRLYSGLVDGAVVATSMLIATGKVGGIYWVATLEAQRGRGYGEALTWAAVAGGRELGCGIASLQASKLGRPVYARMGFAHVLDYAHYLPPEA